MLAHRFSRSHQYKHYHKECRKWMTNSDPQHCLHTQEVPPLSAAFQGCAAATSDALDLLAGLMALNPSQRLTAEQVFVLIANELLDG